MQIPVYRSSTKTEDVLHTMNNDEFLIICTRAASTHDGRDYANISGISKLASNSQRLMSHSYRYRQHPFPVTAMLESKRLVLIIHLRLVHYGLSCVLSLRRSSQCINAESYTVTLFFFKF